MVLAIWLYLIAARGGFWRAAERDDGAPVFAEAVACHRRRHSRRATRPKAIGETVTSLLRQDYPGAFTVIVVDDQSRDATADVARGAAAALGASDRLTVLPGGPCPPAGPASCGRSSRASNLPKPTPQPPDYLLVHRCRYRL